MTNINRPRVIRRLAELICFCVGMIGFAVPALSVTLNDCKGMTATAKLECTVTPQIIPDWKYMIPGGIKATEWLPSEDAAIAREKEFIAENVGPYLCGPIQHVLGTYDTTWQGHALARFEYNTLWTRWRKPVTFTWSQNSYNDPTCQPRSIVGQYVYAYRDPTCAPSWYGSLYDDPASAFCYRLAPQEVRTCPVGNPVFPQSGTKIETETDYADVGPDALSFARVYRSQWPPGVTLGRLGGAMNPAGAAGWRSAYDRSVQTVTGTPAKMQRVVRPNGTVTMFAWRTDAQGTLRWVPEWGNLDTLTEILDGGGSRTGWQYRAWADDTLEIYDAAGKLQSIVQRDGLTTTLRYSDAATLPEIAPGPGYLIEVVSHFGRSLHLAYDGQGRLVTLTDPAGGVTRYQVGVASATALDNVTFADGTVRTYLHDEAEHVAAGTTLIQQLTGISDERGIRYATFKYNAQGMTVSTEHAGGVFKHTFAYPVRQTTNVTNPLGTQSTLTWIDGPDGNSQLASASQPAGSGCGAATRYQTYDANGNVASRTDFKYIKTCYRNDPVRNLEMVRIEGLWSSTACPTDLAAYAIPTNLPTDKPQRKISTTWHPDWHLETRRAEPLRITTWVHHGQPDPTEGGAIASCAPADALLPDGKPIAVLCKRVEQATTDATGTLGFGATATGTPRVWRYTWNRHGQVLTEDGPRDDVADVTTTAYWPIDAVCPGAAEGAGMDKGCRGLPMSATNALGHVTRYLKYNAHGQLLEMSDANDLTTQFGYDARQRLTSRRTGGDLTEYQYDAAGHLIRVVAPGQGELNYGWDDAGRLVSVSDALGNRIDYTLDAMGNRIREDVTDPGGTLTRTQRRIYDALNRVQNLITPAQ